MKTATLAPQFSARLLGRVTFAVNNCLELVSIEDDTFLQVMRKDSQSAPKYRSKKRSRIHDDPKPAKPSEASHSKIVAAAQPWIAPALHSRPRKSAKH